MELWPGNRADPRAVTWGLRILDKGGLGLKAPHGPAGPRLNFFFVKINNNFFFFKILSARGELAGPRLGADGEGPAAAAGGGGGGGVTALAAAEAFAV